MEISRDRSDTSIFSEIRLTDGSAVCQDAKCVEAWLKSKIAHPSEALKQSNIWRGSSTMRVESGIIAIDKERHSRTLATLEKDYKEYVKVSHGEKEAWWIAAELTGNSRTPSHIRASAGHVLVVMGHILVIMDHILVIADHILVIAGHIFFSEHGPYFSHHRPNLPFFFNEYCKN